MRLYYKHTDFETREYNHDDLRGMIACLLINQVFVEDFVSVDEVIGRLTREPVELENGYLLELDLFSN